ncbi:MAG: hypothetical protein OSB14_09665 [Planctomycetota bacterium]|nr:hypothetical protein [Planctomycetota bacterium]
MVTASRNYVCIRPKSFEDEDESEILLSIFSGRQGRLENTVFTLMDSEAKKELVRSGRSPKWISKGADDFAETLKEISAEHPQSSKGKSKERSLPVIKGLKLAMNVAACDSMPLVVAVGKNEKAMKKMSALLEPLAWSDDFVGRFRWVSLSDTKELAEYEGMPKKAGLYVIQPDAYGVSCELLAEASDGAKSKQLKAALAEGLAAFEAPRIKRRGLHVREGERKGYSWEHATGHSERVPFTGKKD